MPPVKDFFLELEFPTSLDSIVNKSSIVIKARTRVDALVTVNDYILEPDINGRFQQEISLEQGLNIIEIIASASTGEQKSIVLGVGYSNE